MGGGGEAGGVPVVVLLPPSEAKAAGGRGAWEVGSGLLGETLGPARLAVAEALARLGTSPEALALTGVKGARAVEEAALNASVVGAPTLAAGRRYQGVVWDHLSVTTLTHTARRRAAHVLVPSPLGGLWALGDPVPDHKLKMGAAVAGVGSLVSYWRPLLPPALEAVAGRGPVVDLLPAEHRRALPLDGLRQRVVTVDFTAADGRGAAGHAAKAAKGVIARRLLEAGGDPVEGLDGYSWQGWRVRVHDARTVEVRAPS